MYEMMTWVATQVVTPVRREAMARHSSTTPDGSDETIQAANPLTVPCISHTIVLPPRSTIFSSSLSSYSHQHQSSSTSSSYSCRATQIYHPLHLHIFDIIIIVVVTLLYIIWNDDEIIFYSHLWKQLFSRKILFYHQLMLIT